MDNKSFSPIEYILNSIISQNIPSIELHNCFSHLSFIISNLITYPNEEKYRIIKLSNEKMNKEVFSFEGTMPFLSLIGFKTINNILKYSNQNENENNLNQALIIIRNKLKIISENLILLQTAKENPISKIILERKKEIEEQKIIKENIIKDFESNKKYNLILKKKETERISINYQKFHPNIVKKDSSSEQIIPKVKNYNSVNQYKGKKDTIVRRNTYVNSSNKIPIKPKKSSDIQSHFEKLE